MMVMMMVMIIIVFVVWPQRLGLITLYIVNAVKRARWGGGGGGGLGH
jgi:hypothetical protein